MLLPNQDETVITLTVKNHPGVMSHITGLFSRRGFNLEGIICGRIGKGKTSRIYLLVERSQNIEQIIYQLKKLYDVLTVEECIACNTKVFYHMDSIMREAEIDEIVEGNTVYTNKTSTWA